MAPVWPRTVPAHSRSCSSTAELGDRALVYVTGVGILYEWSVTSSARREPEWRFVCDVEHVRTLDPPITLDELRRTFSRDEWAPPYQNFRGWKSIRIPDQIADQIRKLRPATADAAAS